MLDAVAEVQTETALKTAEVENSPWKVALQSNHLQFDRISRCLVYLGTYKGTISFSGALAKQAPIIL